MNSYSRNTSPRPDRLCPIIIPPRGALQLSSVQRPSASLAQSPASHARSSTVAAGLAAARTSARPAATIPINLSLAALYHLIATTHNAPPNPPPTKTPHPPGPRPSVPVHHSSARRPPALPGPAPVRLARPVAREPSEIVHCRRRARRRQQERQTRRHHPHKSLPRGPLPPHRRHRQWTAQPPPPITPPSPGSRVCDGRLRAE